MKLVKKYAKVLFDEATLVKVVAKVLEEVSALSDAIFLRADVSVSLLSPATKNKSKILLEEVMKKYKFTSLTSNFIGILAGLKRLKLLPLIATEYKKLIDTAGGIKFVDVISSVNQSTAERTKIERLLSSRLADKIVVNYSVDNTIIGGIIVKYDSMIIDASIKGAIDTMFKKGVS